MVDRRSTVSMWLASSNVRSREELLQMAKLAESAERYYDMATVMKSVIELGDELGNEERNLLSVAFKNVVGSLRCAWRSISSIEIKVEGNDKKLAMATWYREQIERELQKLCKDVLSLLELHLLKQTAASESQVFYRKMEGDYFRYLAEAAPGEERQSAVDGAELAYRTATDFAERELQAANPVRLGLALNYAVFQFEIKGDPEKACQMATKAFESAIADLGSLPTGSYRDATLIMQLLRDNLTLWTAEQFDDTADQ